LATREEPRIAWDWSGAARGALSALPGGAIVLGDVTVGIVVALGALVVAMLGGAPDPEEPAAPRARRRRGRPPGRGRDRVDGRGTDEPLVRRAGRLWVDRALAQRRTSRSAFDISFSEPLVETAIGAALALTFAIAIPWLVHAVRDRDRLEA
jgi:hypothetical protein